MYHSHWSVPGRFDCRSDIKVGLKTEVDGVAVLVEKTDSGLVFSEVTNDTYFHLPDEPIDVPEGLQQSLEIAYRAHKEFERIALEFVSSLPKEIGP